MYIISNRNVWVRSLTIICGYHSADELLKRDGEDTTCSINEGTVAQGNSRCLSDSLSDR